MISALYECLFKKFILHSWCITIKLNDKSTSISTLLDSLISASKISNLTQGMFVGDGSDNLKETIEANYKRVKQEELSLVASEIERIKNDPNLKGLIKE